MIALIPARGGSKGVPGKNIRPLKGKPLIAYAIDCAKGSKYVDRVIVSTDDPETADVARRYGAEVPFLRPAHLATDSSMAVDTYIYTVDRLAETENASVDSFVVLLPTTPLRTSGDVDRAIGLFLEKNADSVISYTPEAHPVRWHKYINDDGSFENVFEETLANRQELRKSYYPNGAIYVFRTSVVKARKYYTDNSYAYVMPRERSVDIDTEEDFRLAEFLLGDRGTGR